MLLLQLRSRTFCFPRPIHLQYHQQVGLDPGVHQGWSQEYSINQITITERDNFVNFALTRENYVTFQGEIRLFLPSKPQMWSAVVYVTLLRDCHVIKIFLASNVNLT